MKAYIILARREKNPYCKFRLVRAALFEAEHAGLPVKEVAFLTAHVDDILGRAFSLPKPSPKAEAPVWQLHIARLREQERRLPLQTHITGNFSPQK